MIYDNPIEGINLSLFKQLKTFCSERLWL